MSSKVALGPYLAEREDEWRRNRLSHLIDSDFALQ